MLLNGSEDLPSAPGIDANSLMDTNSVLISTPPSEKSARCVIARKDSGIHVEDHDACLSLLLDSLELRMKQDIPKQLEKEASNSDTSQDCANEDDTAECYQLMDKAYEWALDTMRLVSQSASADTMESVSRQIERLQIAESCMPSFEEMHKVANSDKLRTYCQTVRERCDETSDLLRTRQLTLQRMLQQMEGSPRTRSHSVPFTSVGFSGQERRRSTGGVASGSYTAFPSAYYPTVPRVPAWAITRHTWFMKENSIENVKPTLRKDIQTDLKSTDCDKPIVEETETPSNNSVMLILQELIQTEREYVKSLEYIIENYVSELLRDDVPQALRGKRNVVFGNLEKLHEFHSRYFLVELEHAEPHTLGQCFLDFQPQFFLYALYSKNKPKSDALMAEYGHEFFKAKQLELGDKMDLASYLLKPVQRVAKYALLLKQMLKECSHSAIKEAEEMVCFQLRHGNDLLAMDALKDCDVNVKEQGLLLRQDEFIVSQGGGRKSLRRIFLFQDLVLFSKAKNDHFHYKHSIKTCEMGLTEQVCESDTRFEIWFRKRKLADTFLLQATNSATKKAWVNDLRDILTAQALHSKKNRLAELSSMGIGNKPCLDIQPSEDQICERSIRADGIYRHRNSLISVSSSNFSGTLNLGFEDSPRLLHRSSTHHSHCSTESGFCTDPGEGLTSSDTTNDENMSTAM